MRFNKILVTGFDKSNLDQKVWQRISKFTKSIVFKPSDDVDCLFCRFNKVDKELIDTLPNLKYIGLLATGTGTVDLKLAKIRNITVCNIPGYATESVAEWVFGLILEHLRDLKRAKEAAQKGDFTGNGFSATQICGKKFGIIGLGRIGLRVAQIAQGFGANVSYWSRNRKTIAERNGLKYETIDSIVKTSDFVSLHALTTKETENILNPKKIKSLKKGCVVINVSGMEQVNIPALVKRLAKGDITFILDHPDEMNPKDVSRLSKYKNCLIYPPIGYVSQEARILKQDIFVSNIQNYLKGKPINKVN